MLASSLRHLHNRSSNPLMGTLKPQSNGPLYSNMAIGKLAVDGLAVTFGTTRILNIFIHHKWQQKNKKEKYSVSTKTKPTNFSIASSNCN